MASPVQHPQELRSTVAAAAEAIVRIRSAFINCYRFRNASCAPYTGAQEKSGLPLGKPASNSLLSDYFVAIGTGATSGDEPHEPHEVERAIPAAAAAIAIIFTNFIVFISFIFCLERDHSAPGWIYTLGVRIPQTYMHPQQELRKVIDAAAAA